MNTQTAHNCELNMQRELSARERAKRNWYKLNGEAEAGEAMRGNSI